MSEALRQHEQAWDQLYPERSVLFFKSGTVFHYPRSTAWRCTAITGPLLRRQRLLVRQTAEEAMALLPATFVRVHRTHIVPLDRVETEEAHQVRMAGERVPVGA